MASPPSRQPIDRRMRASSPRSQRVDRRIQETEERTRRSRRPLLIALGAVILMIIGAVVGYGYYEAFIAPPRVLAARVEDTRYTQGDLVKRLRMLQSIATATGQTFDFSTQPFEILMAMAEAEVIRRSAPRYGLEVTDADVAAVLRQRFEPFVPADEVVAPGQIQQEYREKYQRFLDNTQLSGEDYRKIVVEDIYRAKLRAELGKQVPSVGEQVEVRWIVMPLPERTPGVPDPPSYEEILELVEQEGFEGAARRLSIDRTYSDREGYVGWVPREAFTFLDEVFFGSAEKEPIPSDEISEAVASTQAVYIVKVTAGPEVRQISGLMREALKDQALKSWLLEQQEIGAEEGWWEVRFNSEIYSWVVKQVRSAGPRGTPDPPSIFGGGAR